MKIRTASGIVSATWRAPWTSISSTTGAPAREPLLEVGAQRAVAAARVVGVLDERRPRRHAARRTPRRRGSGSRRRASSPGRGARVVADTDSSSSGTRSSSVRISVPLPTPDGPVITKTAPAGATRYRRSMETSSVRWRCERPADRLRGRDPALLQDLVDLDAAVLGDGEQHVEHLGGLDVLRRLEQEVVDARRPALRSRLSCARRVRISFARWRASIRWTRERSGAATVGLVGRLGRWRHGRRVYIRIAAFDKPWGTNSPRPQVEVEDACRGVDGNRRLCRAFRAAMCYARAGRRRGAPAAVCRECFADRAASSAAIRAPASGSRNDSVPTATRSAPARGDRRRGVRTGRRPCRRSGARPRCGPRDLGERDRADRRPGHAAGAAAEPRLARAARVDRHPAQRVDQRHGVGAVLPRRPRRRRPATRSSA